MNRNQLYEGLKAHFSAEQMKQLAAVRVGIAGAGGLGSNVAGHLVRSGIRRLVIADFDHVEASNLNRQFYFADQVGMRKTAALEANLRRIDPDLDLNMVDIRLDAANAAHTFRDCEIVVEALDRANDKKMMAECFLTAPCMLVSASGIGGWGDSDRIRTRKLGDRCVLVGDGFSEISKENPATAAIVGIVAAKQADAVVEAVLNR
ncbi:MAG: thiamine biosynthesis protein ThiF [Proteobacteria bacterium]|nr:MAG: thiamine biosynthesis protein ThiF [Pseudomonadota bacterium]